MSAYDPKRTWAAEVFRSVANPRCNDLITRQNAASGTRSVNN